MYNADTVGFGDGVGVYVTGGRTTLVVMMPPSVYWFVSLGPGLGCHELFVGAAVGGGGNVTGPWDGGEPMDGTPVEPPAQPAMIAPHNSARNMKLSRGPVFTRGRLAFAT